MYTNCLNIWFIIALIVFIVVSVIHLRRCVQGKEGLADITKFVLMPVLLLAFLSCAIIGGDFSLPSLLILIALVFSFLGDWALIFDWEKRFFVLGSLFFALTHICYVVFAIIKFKTVEFPFLVAGIVLVIFILALSYVLLRMRKFLKGLKGLYILYSLILITMSVLFIALAVAMPITPTILAAVGSMVFIASDYMVGYQHFLGGIRKARFFIMLSYILAQALIILGALGMLA